VLSLRQTRPGERVPARDRPAPAALLHRVRSAWGARERLADLERAVADAPRRRGIVIAVASLERGCGKTTVTALLAALLARSRPQPPLAIDGDLSTRALSRMLAPAYRMTSATYLDLVERRLRLADLRPAAIGRAGVRLLPAPDRPELGPDAAGCRALLAELRATHGVTVLDCAAGFGTPWAQAAWAQADQFVLVTGGEPSGQAALEPVTASLSEAGAAVAAVTLPDDPTAATLLRAGELPWEAAPSAWRSAVAGAAASLVARW
jgi:Mrp family chromosome partitioning ATPase